MKNGLRATRADVAKLAGVSTATVSYVLNKSRNLSEETKSRVLSAVAELDYKPDMIARSMKKKETKQLGIVLENIINPYYGEIIFGFENAAVENGYFVNICTGNKNLNEYFDNFISRRLDGIFCAAIPYRFNMDILYSLVDAGIKIVRYWGAGVDLKRISAVELDYKSAMDTAIGHLFQLGHTKIAYLSGLGRNLSFDKRIEGYITGLISRGLNYGDDLLYDGSPPYTTEIKDGYTLAMKLLASGKTFTAVICNNDLMAMGAMRQFQEKGYRIPEDISVMGFDDSIFTAAWNPPITTMAVNKSLLGAKAFELLHTNIKKDNTGFYLGKYELIIRESTCTVR